MNRSLRGCLLLALTAMIWGTAFVAQDVAMDSLPPFAFNAIRMALAAVTLLGVVVVMDNASERRRKTAPKEFADVNFTLKNMSGKQCGTLLICGTVCGVLLALASSFQQFGISLGSGAGKAGFVTALYIVLVPVTGLFTGKRVGANVWVAVALSTLGLYLLCVKSGFVLEKGDIYLMLCAVMFTGHILVIDRMSKLTDCVKMSCVQFIVASVACGAVSLATEVVTWQNVKAALIPILYSGLLSGAVGYTLQMVAQKDVEPTLASLIMCLESLFAVLAGWAILGERLSARELIGCAAMMSGILLAQGRVRVRGFTPDTPDKG